MSQINFTRKTFLEKEEIARLQEFLRDSPSENAIIGNTSKWGILRTDFQSDTDFLVEPSSNSGRVKIEKAENKAIAKGGKMIYQEAIDNIEVPSDNKWYWMRIKYKYITYEKGIVSINSSGQVIGTGTAFRDVLRGQATLVPTKVKFLKLDGTPATNLGFYEVVDIVDDNNMTLTSAVDFVAESNLRMVVLGTTPLGEMLSEEQKEGLYRYDSCEIEFRPEDENDTETPPHRSMDNPDLTFIQDEMFYIARVKNNAGFVDVDNNNTYVRNEFWEFNVVGLTDKLSIFNNLSDLNNPDLALTNLGLTTAGKNLSKISPNSYPTYLRLETNGTVKKMMKEAMVNDFRNYLNTLFLQRSENLYDISDIVAARTNLDVYSKSETYNKTEAVSSNMDIRKSIFQIGDWDMINLETKNVTLTGISLINIVNVNVFIISDLDAYGASTTNAFKLNYAGHVRITRSGAGSTVAVLKRNAYGDFVNSVFSEIGYNRGYVVVEHIES